MFKKLIALVLTVAMLLSFTACDVFDSNKNVIYAAEMMTEELFGEEKPDKAENDDTQGGKNTEKIEYEESNCTPLLYKVSDDNGNVIWLFGSIHIGGEDFYPLPEYVLRAFDNSDALAVEVDMIEYLDNMDVYDLLQDYLLTDGTTITDHISEEVYEKAVEILKENNYYMEILDMYKPCFWQDLIDSFAYDLADIDTENGIDMHLLERAYDMDKEIISVESAEFQMELLTGFSMELQAVLLESSIYTYENYEELAQEANAMTETWAKGDPEELREMMDSEDDDITDPKEKELYEEYSYALAGQRDINMTNFVVDSLKSGEEIFMCVGAAHVVGDDAMIERLTDLGYKIEQVKE